MRCCFEFYRYSPTEFMTYFTYYPRYATTLQPSDVWAAARMNINTKGNLHFTAPRVNPIRSLPRVFILKSDGHIDVPWG